MKRTVLSFAVAMALVFGYCPMAAYADVDVDGLYEGDTAAAELVDRKPSEEPVDPCFEGQVFEGAPLSNQNNSGAVNSSQETEGVDAAPSDSEGANRSDFDNDSNNAQIDSGFDADSLALSNRVSIASGTYLISPAADPDLFLGFGLEVSALASSQAQVWSIEEDQAGFVTIQSQYSDEYLSVQDGSIALTSSLAEDWSKWAILQLPEGDYEICNVETGVALGLDAGGSAPRAKAQACQRDAAEIQGWSFTNLNEAYNQMDLHVAGEASVIPSDSIIYLASALSQALVLDVANGSAADGANVQIYASNMTPAQQWRVTYDEIGYATFINVKTGKALDVDNGKAVAGANVQQHSPNGTRAQKWVVKDNGDGTMSILSALMPGLALDVANGSASSGANVQIYSDNGTAAQKWVAIDEQGFYEQLDELASSSPRLIEAGSSVLLSSALSQALVLDVANGSAADGANVQIYASNMTPAQQWRVTYDEIGYATFINVKTGKALDVDNGKAVAGANVQQHSPNGTRAQKWVVKDNGDGTMSILSALMPGLALDVANGSASSGANVQIYSDNGTAAQKWVAIPTVPEVAPCEKLDLDGRYFEVTPKSNASLAFDVESGSLNNGANVRLWQRNGTLAQLYSFEFVPSNNTHGYYRIVNARTGKALDVAGGNLVPTTNVQQWEIVQNEDNQLFSIRVNDDDSLSFINKATGLVIDVQNGSVSSGTNIWAYFDNGSNAQRFVLKERTDLLFEGLVNICSALNHSKVLDVDNGSVSNGANVQLYGANGTIAQKWELRRVGDNAYSIQSVVSGLYLTNDSNGNVCQRPQTEDGSQYWIPSISGGYYILENQLSGKVLDVASGSATDGANIQVYESNQSQAQQFHLVMTEPLSNATYHILNTSNRSLAIDVSNGSYASGANVQIFTKNDSGAQKWDITQNSDGSYTLINSQSKNALDVSNGKAVHGANVQQYSPNGSAAQKWQILYNSDGTYRLASKLNEDLALTVTGSLSSGSNVAIEEYTGAPSQKFTFEQTAYVPPVPANVQAMINRANGYSSNTQYLILVNRGEHLVGVFQGSQNNWNLIYSWSCVVGKPSTPTITGTYRTTGFKRPHLTTDSRAIYCTQINGGYFFHSILVSESELGNSLSHGCVRLPYDAAYWIYTNIGAGTTVSIYN